ncbi:hypothetical protein NHX12_009876, partial [Muraenolepis orangiensis]
NPQNPDLPDGLSCFSALKYSRSRSSAAYVLYRPERSSCAARCCCPTRRRAAAEAPEVAEGHEVTEAHEGAEVHEVAEAHKVAKVREVAEVRGGRRGSRGCRRRGMM